MSASVSMAARVEAYLAERRRVGFALTIAGTQLAASARFADGLGHRGPLTLALATQWACSSQGRRPLTAARRIEVLRGFARYCQRDEPSTEIPPRRLLGPAHRRLRPHIYSAAEVDRTRRRRPRARPLADPADQVRQVALDAAPVDDGGGARPLRRSPRRRLPRRPPHRVLRLRLRARGGYPQPRPHDLRHTFVCRRLEQWYRENRDIDRHVLMLSTYVGHAKVTDTYWYLSATPEPLALAARRAQSVDRSRP